MHKRGFRIICFMDYLIHSRTIFKVHSPFVYRFVKHLKSTKTSKDLKIINQIKNQAKQNRGKIYIKDEGLGGQVVGSSIRKRALVSSAAKRTTRIIHQTIIYFKPINIIETGTNLGFSSISMALANPSTMVYSIEADKTLIEYAWKNIMHSNMSNIELIHGAFEEKLPQVLEKVGYFGLAFIDGNHKYRATIQYFHLFLKHITSNSIIIFDDICWSQGMNRAWKEIIKHPSISISINFGSFGMVFFKERLRKQNFVLRV